MACDKRDKKLNKIIKIVNTFLNYMIEEGIYKVLDLSKEGLCIGTSTVQEECHVHHPSLQCKNRLEMEVDLDPCMAPMKTFGEVKWYMQDKNEKGTMFKFRKKETHVSAACYMNIV